MDASTSPPDTPYSVTVLQHAAALQIKKGQDYQARESSVRQVDYYPRGVLTILDIIRAKELRARSITEKIAGGGEPNFESLEDSLIDLINYASFAVAYVNGKMDGQDPSRFDIVGRRK